MERVAIDLSDILQDVPVVPISDTLSQVGVEVQHRQKQGIFDDQRKAWDNTIEARCDFSTHISMQHRAGVYFHSIWKKTPYGRTLTDIKSDPDMVGFFADHLSSFILDVIGSANKSSWSICTSPKRRHTENNFATRIAYLIADRIGVTMVEDVAFARSRQRINAVFDLGNLPETENVIVIDDFVTTGSTLRAMQDLLHEHNKNTLFFAGINNKI